MDMLAIAYRLTASTVATGCLSDKIHPAPEIPRKVIGWEDSGGSIQAGIWERVNHAPKLNPEFPAFCAL
jgi:hypothetical protein